VCEDYKICMGPTLGAVSPKAGPSRTRSSKLRIEGFWFGFRVSGFGFRVSGLVPHEDFDEEVLVLLLYPVQHSHGCVLRENRPTSPSPSTISTNPRLCSGHVIKDRKRSSCVSKAAYRMRSSMRRSWCFFSTSSSPT